MKFIIGKKAMGIQQVFVFIVSAIVLAMIIIFGYSAITDFLEKGEQVEFFQFKSSLESSISKIYSEYGAVRQQDYSLPMRYEQICFVDLDAEYDSALCDFNAVACDVWETAYDSQMGYDGVDENVFLKPSAEVAIKVRKLEIDGGFLCLPIEGGSFSLRLEGRGSKALVEEISYE